MAEFIKGDIVVIPFPFSYLSGSKRRPAYVLFDLPGNDIVLCQITSRHTKDRFSIELSGSDFSNGSLPMDSYIRPTRIFTSDKSIIVRKAGTVKKNITDQIVQRIIELLK